MNFTGLVIVCAVAFAAPFLLGLVPQLRLPAVVLEILVGIAIGPAGLGWVAVDQPIRVLSIIGLAFLLFLAGLELDIRLLRGTRLKVALGAFALSGALTKTNASALVAAGLLSVVIFPMTAMTLLRRVPQPKAATV